MEWNGRARAVLKGCPVTQITQHTYFLFESYSKMPSKEKSEKKCRKLHVINPLTNRCVNIYGQTYKSLVDLKIIKKAKKATTSPVETKKPKTKKTEEKKTKAPKAKAPEPKKPKATTPKVKKIPVSEIKIDIKNRRTYSYVVKGETKKVVSDLTSEQAYSVLKASASQTKFSESILEAYEKNGGSLTERQMSWLMKLAVETFVY